MPERSESFDLLSQPWIRCRLLTGETTELSVYDVMRRANEIRSLAGEVATQDIAVLRFLLAVLHRSLPRDQHDDPVDLWEELWDAGGLPLDAITAYLDQWEDRFDLLHPEKPFMQVPDLRTAKGEIKEVRLLVTDVPNGDQFFTTRAGVGLRDLSLAEAARWLVHTHAFDISGIKSGAVGDSEVKGGKGYPIGTGWAGQLGCVVVEGENLAETLLLNLVPGATGPNDQAVWERGVLTAARDISHPVPKGYADLLTWPSRRVRLFTEDEQVVGVLICNGDPLSALNTHGLEMMSGWRFSENQMKARGGVSEAFMPRTHNPERGLWRGLDALLADAEPVQLKERTFDRYLSPGVLNWLATLVDEVLPENMLVRARAVGIEYGPQSSSVAAMIDNQIVLPTRVLADRDCKREAVSAATSANKAAIVIKRLADRLAKSAGADPDVSSAHAFEMALVELEPRFRSWVLRLTRQEVLDEADREWQSEVSRTVYRMGQDLVDNTGPAALVGRVIKDGRDERFMDAALAFQYFTNDLRRELPRAVVKQACQQPTEKEGVSA